MQQRDAFDEAFLSDDTPPMDAADWLAVAVIGIGLCCAIVVLLAVV